MDLSVFGLDRGGIGIGAFAFHDVLAPQEGPSLIFGNGHGQRRTFVHVIVKDEEKMPVGELLEVERRVRILESGIRSFGPRLATIC